MARVTLMVLVGALVAVSLAATLTVPRGESQLTAWDETATGYADARRLMESNARTSQLRALVAGPSALALEADVERHLLVVAGAERAYTGGEMDRLEAFQQRGGTLLLFVKNAAMTDLLARYGVEVDGRDVLSTSGAAGFVDVTARVPGAATTNELRLFRPTSLGLVPGWEGGQIDVLANTSADSFIDVDGNGNVTPDLDIAASFPVVVHVVPDEGGTVLVVADPVAFTNQDLRLAENRAYLENLLNALVPSDATVVIDESRHVQGQGWPKEMVRLVLLGASGRVALVVGALTVVAAVVLAVRHKGLVPYGHVFQPETVVAVPDDEAGARALITGDEDAP